MFGQLSAGLLQFFLRKKWFSLLLFAAIVAFLVNGLRQLKIEEDIYSVFPKGGAYSKFSKILSRNNLNKQVVFSVAASDDRDGDFERLDSVSRWVSDELETAITELQVYRMVDENVLVNYLQHAALAFSDSTDYERMDAVLVKDSIRSRLVNTKEKLMGSSAIFLGAYFAQDPLNLLGPIVQRIGLSSDSSNYRVEDGIVYSEDGKRLLFFATITADLKKTDQLVALDAQLEALQAKINRNDPTADFDYFGTFQIAAKNAVQVKKDTFYTLLVSVGLIVLLLIFFYRSVLAPLYFVLPAGFGILSGVGAVGYLQPEVSAISLATSGVLLGIVLDYAFHFFTHYKHSGNLVDTVREISSPMIVGSFTTVAAFAALLFTDSVVLQNFGLIALFTLLGAALFTLFFLPVFMALFRIRLRISERSEARGKLPRWVLRTGILVIVGFTVFSLITQPTVGFDADLNNLSYHPAELKQKEDAFTGIYPGKEKKIYVFATATNEEEARAVNERIFSVLTANKERLNISELVSTAPYLLSTERQTQALSRWKRFWSEEKNSLDTLTVESEKLGFSEQAFSPFETMVHTPEFPSEVGEGLLREMGLRNFIHSEGSETSILTSVVVNQSGLAELKAQLREVDGAYILDISELTSGMLESVRADFNFLLLFSSLLVFGSLLIVYGRIELALFAFLPMVLAWLWIMSLSALLGLEFNFVNIIIATFIFGLGDDFSIFITDGLIQRYKTGRDSISSYKSAIILSAVTTIIGTGALYFAKHPAIHSIALISVIGILAILTVTLYVQPHLFHWFVTRRTARGRGPITFFTCIYSCMLFTYFFVGSMLLSVVLIFVLIPFPAPKKRKKEVMNYLVTRLAKSTLYAGFHIKKTVLDQEKLDYTQPKILVANHASFLDILAVLMLHPKTIIMVKKWVYNSPVFGLFIRYCGYIFAEEGASGNVEEIRQRFADGYSLVIFPEGTRSRDGNIKRFHKGAFLLAQELDVPVQPLLLIGIHEVNPRNDIMINRGTIIVKPLDAMYAEEGERYKAFTARVQQTMREAFAEVRREHATARFWFPPIMQNYVLKGPVLEWYVRVKYRLEQRNFEFYDNLISDRRRILDVGCGYGYLSYYLHYRQPNRTITGLDYDEEKILTAAHAIKKSDGLHFAHADIRRYDFGTTDVVFLNDVLHYLPAADQQQVLERAVAALTEDGILFIRDGVKELKDRFRNTKWTERFSTKWFKFNKTENDLEFLSIAEVEAFAKKNGLSCKMIEHSKTTSNVLFVLRKGNGAGGN